MFEPLAIEVSGPQSCSLLLPAAMGDLRFDFDMDQPAQPSAPASAEPPTKSGCANPCQCCFQEERVSGSRYGVQCKRGLNNVTNQEKKEGLRDPERKKRFEQVRKEAGPALHALILAYLRTCDPSSGRGKSRVLMR